MRKLADIALDLIATFDLPPDLLRIARHAHNVGALNSVQWIKPFSLPSLAGGTGYEILGEIFRELPAPETPRQYKLHDELREILG